MSSKDKLPEVVNARIATTPLSLSIWLVVWAVGFLRWCGIV